MKTLTKQKQFKWKQKLENWVHNLQGEVKQKFFSLSEKNPSFVTLSDDPLTFRFITPSSVEILERKLKFFTADYFLGQFIMFFAEILRIF